MKCIKFTPSYQNLQKTKERKWIFSRNEQTRLILHFFQQFHLLKQTCCVCSTSTHEPTSSSFDFLFNTTHLCVSHLQVQYNTHTHNLKSQNPLIPRTQILISHLKQVQARIFFPVPHYSHSFSSERWENHHWLTSQNLVENTYTLTKKQKHPIRPKKQEPRDPPSGIQNQGTNTAKRDCESKRWGFRAQPQKTKKIKTKPMSLYQSTRTKAWVRESGPFSIIIECLFFHTKRNRPFDEHTL